MKYCSECGNPVMMVKFARQNEALGDMMGCERCKAVFVCLTDTNLPIGKNPAWKKHMFNLDEIRKIIKENSPR